MKVSVRRISEQLREIHETRLHANLDCRDTNQQRLIRFVCTSAATLIAVTLVGVALIVLQVVARIGEHRGFICDIAVDPETDQVVTIDLFSHVCVWDSSAVTLIRSGDAHGFSPNCVHALPNGGGLLLGGIDATSGGADAGLAWFDVAAETDGLSRRWTERFGRNAAIRKIAATPDGQLIALGTVEYGPRTCRVILYDVAEQTVVREIQPAAGMAVTALEFSPSAKRLAYATGDIGNLSAPGLLVIESLDSPGDRRSLSTPRAAVTSVQFKHDETELLTADDAGYVSTFDTATASELRFWDVDSHSVEQIALVGSERYLLVAGTKSQSLKSAARPASISDFSSRGMIQIWHLKTNELLDEKILPHGVLAGIAVIDDGQRVAAVSYLDRYIMIFDFSNVILPSTSR